MQPTKPSQIPVNLGQMMDEFEVSTISSKQSLSSISSQCSEMQEEIMAEELLKVMNFAASKIQALWRGYCTRKQLYIEQGAAMLLQAFWRGYQVRKLVQVPVSKPLLIHIKSLASWAQCQEERRPLQAGQIHIQSRQHCQLQSKQLPIQKGPMWTSSLQRKILAATIIQAYWRGYVVRRDLAIKTGAAIFIQSFYRGYLARRNLKANSIPDPIPEDEEAKMVAYNISFGPGHFKTQTPVPGSPQWNCSSFQTAVGSRKVPSPRNRLAENASFLYSGNNDCVSGKGDTVQATKPRRLLSWYPDSRQENDASAGTMSTIRTANKSSVFVPGYFIEGAGDTTSMSGQYSTIQTQPKYISPVRELKGKGLDPIKSGKWEKYQNVKNKDRMCQQNILGITAARPRYSYRGLEPVEDKGERNKSVSQYLVKCTPYASGNARKLIRYREDSSSVSSLTSQPFNEAPVSKLDFDPSEREVPRRAPSCCRKSSARKTLKQMREENAAAGTIQAVWKGHCARRFLRQQADAATKIQAIFRSYRIRKEFANEGIFPLAYAKESCKYLNKDRVSQTASRSNRPQFEGGPESSGDGATDYPTSGDSQRTGTDSRHINCESETLVQPSQRLETAKREMPVCSSATPASVLEVEETPSSSAPAVTPGSEGRNCSQTHHWMQKTVQTRKQYQMRINAACTIQAGWRGYQVRCSIRKQSEAATKIQAHFRGSRIRKLLSNMEREEGLSDSTDGASWETPDSETGAAPDYLYLKTDVANGHAAREPPRKRVARIQVEFCCQRNPAWREQAKPDGPAIFVKRNPCYNPRKVTIHVKAAGGDMG